MAQLSQIILKNYKSLRNVDFEMHDLNILIGRNGSGKSNLLSFFRLMQRAADGRLTDSIRTMGGLDELRWRGCDPDETVDWELTFEDLKSIEKTMFHTGKLAARGSNFSIQVEEVSHDPYPDHTDRYKFLGAYNGYVRILKEKSESEDDVSAGFDYDDQELVIAQFRDPIRYAVLNEIRRTLVDWTLFRGFGENAIDHIYDSQSLDVISPLRLDPEGRNLVSVLHTLANEQRHVSAQDELESILSEAFPDFGRLAFPAPASGKVELQWRNVSGWQFPARSISDGMLRFLGLATLLLLPDPPPLIAIDEPEVGLHPRLIPLLAGLLKSASSRTQIVVATHSPQLLNAEAIEAEDVVVVEQKEGETTLDRQDYGRLRLWLDRYTLGNLWTMGKLEH